MSTTERIEHLMESMGFRDITFTKIVLGQGATPVPYIKAQQMLTTGPNTPPRVVEHHIPRNTFGECLNALAHDAEIAIKAEWSIIAVTSKEEAYSVVKDEAHNVVNMT